MPFPTIWEINAIDDLHLSISDFISPTLDLLSVDRANFASSIVPWALSFNCLLSHAFSASLLLLLALDALLLFEIDQPGGLRPLFESLEDDGSLGGGPPSGWRPLCLFTTTGPP